MYQQTPTGMACIQGSCKLQIDYSDATCGSLISKCCGPTMG